MSTLTPRNLGPKLLVRKLFGNSLYPTIKHLKVYWDQRMNRPYEVSPALPFLLQPGDVAFDIGANIGHYVGRFSKAVGPSGKVFSFEPVKANFKWLSKTKAWMGLKNAEIINAGVSNVEGRTTIYIPVLSSGLVADTRSSIVEGEVKMDNTTLMAEEIDLVTVDGTVAKYGLTRLDLIKSDAEGVDPLVFRGAEKSIRQHMPILMTELRMSKSGDAYNWLLEMGYEPYFVRGEKVVPIDRADAQTSRALTILIPKERLSRLQGHIA